MMALLKEPLAQVSKRCAASSPSHSTRSLSAFGSAWPLPVQGQDPSSAMGPTRMGALSAEADEDSSFEILGPFPRASSRDLAEEAKPNLHPFFAKGDEPPVGVSPVRKLPSKATKSTKPTIEARPTASVPAPPTKAAPKAKARAKASSSASAPTHPIYTYKAYTPTPTVVYTRHEEEANDLVGALRGPLGFDLEWRPSFVRGSTENKTALVQLSDESMILLVQVSAMRKFPQGVRDIIESPEVIKLGANIQGDGNKLFRDFGIKAQNLVELGALARHVDPLFAEKHARSVVSLAKVVEHYEGKTLTKGKERMGNWERPLSEVSIHYAANDAHCALMVHKNLMGIAKQNGVTLSPVAYTNNVLGAPAPPPNPSAAASSSSTPTGTASASTTATSTGAGTGVRMPAQALRAYKMWYLDGTYGTPISVMCAQLSTIGTPLRETSVIIYVMKALEVDAALPFNMDKLHKLVKREPTCWKRYQTWMRLATDEGRGV